MKKLALAALLALALTACGGSDDVDSPPPPTDPVSVKEDQSKYGLPRHTSWTEVEHPLGGTIWCLSGGYYDALWCDPTTRTEQ